MEALISGDLNFTASKGISKIEKEADDRDWVDRMFLDFDTREGKKVPIDVCVVDGSNVKSYNALDLGRDNITVVQNLGSSLEGNFQLKNETLIVLGGNRSGRSGTGRIAIPLSQFDKFIEYSKAVQNSVVNQIEDLE